MPCATRASWDTWKRLQSCGGERPAVARCRSIHEVESATHLGHGAGQPRTAGDRGRAPRRWEVRQDTGCELLGEWSSPAWLQFAQPLASHLYEIDLHDGHWGGVEDASETLSRDAHRFKLGHRAPASERTEELKV